MKKVLTILIVVTVAALSVSLLFGKRIYLALASPETRACAKIGDLCADNSKSSGSKDSLDQCVDGLHQARKVAGNAAVDKSLTCIQESDTCMAATGCVVGGVGVGAVKELVKGFGNAFSK